MAKRASSAKPANSLHNISSATARFLFDENLSARLVEALADTYPGSVHLVGLGLMGAPDRAIWLHAQEQGLVIVSKDDDFHRLSIFHGPPPKVIWIRLGNCSTDDIIRVLNERHDEIAAFMAHEEAGFLALA
jgi:predicted nuclease of predicted toxin-antitoxin system